MTTTTIHTTVLAVQCALFQHTIPSELWSIVLAYLQRPLLPGKESIRAAVDLWFSHRQHTLLEYGPMSHWDTHNVTNMLYLFSRNIRNPLIEDDLIPDITHWDTSAVTNMGDMFSGCTMFNQPIGCWSVHRVTNMSDMFHRCLNFNQPLNAWDVRNVTNMSAMFYSATSFNQPVGEWDVQKVENVSTMFDGAIAFNQPLHTWRLTHPQLRTKGFLRKAKAYNQPLPITTAMGGGFTEKGALSTAVHLWFTDRQTCQALYGHLTEWNVRDVTDMSGLFANRRGFNESLANWNVSRVTSMKSMFTGSLHFNQPLDTWDVRNVTDMSGMFNWATAFNQSLSAWRLDSVRDMSKMFCVSTAFKQRIRIEIVDDKGEIVRNIDCNGGLDGEVVVWRVRDDCVVDDVFLGCGGATVPSQL